MFGNSTSLTAYVGLKEIGKPKKGETVLVSTAAGATGIMVCQLAKAWGMNVVGMASAAKKCEWLEKELGIRCINYKAAGANLREEIQKACPKGVDVYYDNVGGEMLDTVFTVMNDFGRIVGCGAISGYLDPKNVHGLKNYFNVITKRLTFKGFIVIDFNHKKEEVLERQKKKKRKKKGLAHFMEGDAEMSEL